MHAMFQALLRAVRHQGGGEEALTARLKKEEVQEDVAFNIAIEEEEVQEEVVVFYHACIAHSQRIVTSVRLLVHMILSSVHCLPRPPQASSSHASRTCCDRTGLVRGMGTCVAQAQQSRVSPLLHTLLLAIFLFSPYVLLSKWFLRRPSPK